MHKVNKVSLKINFAFGPYSVGQIITAFVDDDGVLIDRYWRDRLADSAIDNCISLVEKTKPGTSKSKVPKNDLKDSEV